MYTLGYSFRPWDGEKAIADGPSILRYIKDTAAAERIDEKIRFNHRVVAAAWSSAEGLWHVTAERTDTGERQELTCSFLFSCSGYYRYDHGHQPAFPGMDTFRGTIVHPQFWPEDLSYAGKRVVVIGSGATAVTLIPSLAPDAAHVTMLQRSPTYIASVPNKSPLVGLLRKVLPAKLAGDIVRWTMAVGTQAFFQLSQRRPAVAKRILRKGVERALPAGYDIDTHFTPRYNPWDQRLCAVPNGDLFEAISNGSASVVTDRIDRFTQTGIALESGDELEADIIVTATGLDLLFLGGIDLTVDGEPVDISKRLTYKGMMLEDVPNLAVAVGYTNASWTLKCDLTCDYTARLLNRLHETGLRQCTPVNRDAGVTPQPLLGLTSGYVQRSVDEFPKSGSKFPWQVHQSYLRDYRAMKLRGIDDDAMVFSNPAPAPDAGPGAETEAEPVAATI
jgi:cation diffusion facilitator CzcD-associated flavoprotein CzcO